MWKTLSSSQLWEKNVSEYIFVAQHTHDYVKIYKIVSLPNKSYRLNPLYKVYLLKIFALSDAVEYQTAGTGSLKVVWRIIGNYLIKQ